jgi:uncharacterized membrane protein YphA (DoxX/SURF4 family)
LSYFVGLFLILAGVCLLVNKKARTAATALGLAILLTVFWIYLPRPHCFAILLLANSIDKEAAATNSSVAGSV